MALYSVWNWDRNAYEVYATDRPVSVGDDPTPPNPGPVHLLGAIPDVHVKALPIGARLIGMSHLARGEIVRHRSGGLGGDLGQATGGALIFGGLGVAAGMLLAPRADRRRYAIILGLLGAGYGAIGRWQA